MARGTWRADPKRVAKVKQRQQQRKNLTKTQKSNLVHDTHTHLPTLAHTQSQRPSIVVVNDVAYGDQLNVLA